jgi:N-ethylmaleimide reductase
MLLDPCALPILGELKSRVAMAAMTRGFAGSGNVATADIAEYYGRRADDGVGLILTEGTIIDITGDGYNNVPHIANAQQSESWKQVVDRVHAGGGKIFSQLWHCGRISHADYTGGVPPVSSTNVAAAGHNRQNDKPFGTPRALEASEMSSIHDMYIKAAANALDAGFDGVQLHMGHGYLVDQFFDSRVNDRTDSYGGSVENRCRFALEILEAVLAKIDPGKVMVRISPSRDMGGIYDWPDLDDMLAHLIPAFQSLGLKMLDISCANADYYETSGRIIRMVRPQWNGVLMGGASLSHEQAEKEISEGFLDLITWGRLILANPDFVSRLAANEALQPFDPSMLAELN